MISSRMGPCDEGTIQSVPASHECPDRQKSWVLAATILASGISYIDESVVNVAAPAIETHLSPSAEVIQWVVNAYTLFLSALLLVGGAAGDRFGRLRMFVIGMAIFAAASLGCALSQSISQLIGARAIQGIGAALLVPCSLAIIGAAFDEEERGKAIGTWAGFSAIAAAVGPLAGGSIVDHVSWRWIFAVNLPLALLTIWIAVSQLPESRDADAKQDLDWRGALLVLIGLGSVAYGLIASPVLGWRNAKVVGSLMIGIGFLIAFLWEERRSPNPMLPLDLFQSRTFSVINLLTLLLYGALGGAFFFVPFALIEVQNHPATFAGAMFLPFTIIMGGLSRWSGGLLDRFGARLPLVIGPIISAIGFALLGLAVTSRSYWAFLIPIVVLGFGVTIFVAPLTTTVINAVPAHRTGVASGINNAVASVANLLAIAVLGAVALGLLDRALDQRLASESFSADVRHAVDAARGQFVAEPALATVYGDVRRIAETVIRQSLGESIQIVTWIAAALALGAAAIGGLLPSAQVSRERNRTD